jgi:hypothetical protein
MRFLQYLVGKQQNKLLCPQLSYIVEGLYYTLSTRVSVPLPLPPSECVPPLETKGGRLHSLAG